VKSQRALCLVYKAVAASGGSVAGIRVHEPGHGSGGLVMPLETGVWLEAGDAV
jgi:hypothetical protein